MTLNKERLSLTTTIVCVGLFFGFTLSPAVLSISLIALSVLGIIQFKTSTIDTFEKRICIGMLLFYMLMLISAFVSSNSDEAIRKLILKLPILIFPLLLFALKALKTSHKYLLILCLSYAVFLPGIVSIYNYFSNKVLFDQLILESKPLPIEFGYGIYHIQFSILLACSIVLNAFAIIQHQTLEMTPLQKRLLWLMGILNLIILHILSARTGLLACYVGLFSLMLFQFKFLKPNYRVLTIVITLSIPVLMFIGSQSFRNRMLNTVEDFKVAWEGKDANDYSFALRVQAWKNAVQIIQSHPLIGVGIGDADNELFQQFAISNPSILEHNRKNPHFQLLETAVQSGLLSALILLFLCLYMGVQKHHLALAALCNLLLIASCFESILERQSSVIGFAFMLAFALALNQRPKPTTA